MKYLLITLSLFLLLASGLQSCNRGPSCPAYGGIDPGFSTPNPDDKARETALKSKGKYDNKKEVEKKKKKELSAKRTKKGKSNLFPGYMRKKRR